MKSRAAHSDVGEKDLRKMFGVIAKRYDRTNALLSLGLHFTWNRALCKRLAQFAPESLLDLCAGTGAIGQQMGKRCSSLQRITLVDFCPQMLQIAERQVQAQRKRIAARVAFVEADVQHLPAGLTRGNFDVACIAYGIRNVADPGLVFEEAWKSLKPGGLFAILELTRPNSALLRWVHRMYLRALPTLGGLLTNQTHAYRHLSRSISQFADPQALSNLALEKRFSRVQIRALSGGIATLILCSK